MKSAMDKFNKIYSQIIAESRHCGKKCGKKRLIKEDDENNQTFYKMTFWFQNPLSVDVDYWDQSKISETKDFLKSFNVQFDENSVVDSAEFDGSMSNHGDSCFKGVVSLTADELGEFWNSGVATYGEPTSIQYTSGDDIATLISNIENFDFTNEGLPPVEIEEISEDEFNTLRSQISNADIVFTANEF